MLRIIVIAFSTVALAGVAAALDLGVGVFTSPGVVAGDASEVARLSAGLAGRFSVGVTDRFRLTCGIGYNDFAYQEKGSLENSGHVLTIPIILITPGIEYSFGTGVFHPFVGGGAAIARESAEAYLLDYEVTDWYGGVYALGGVRFSPGGRLGFEAAPRYTFLFDEPAVRYGGGGEFVRSEDHSQLVEVIVGAIFNF